MGGSCLGYKVDNAKGDIEVVEGPREEVGVMGEMNKKRGMVEERDEGDGEGT